ncbi:Purine-cytosine permease FCY21 [Colletotrichum sp. SAR11_240]|nr:Purine-cytosine permease FCY21 [Colletotrichum sp. SAR11_240]
MDRYDEKGMGEKTSSPQGSLEAGSDDSPRETGILATLRRFEGRMDRALGVESHAIDRKTEADKRPVKWHEELTMALLWASGTMGISCFATGFLGWEFGLDLKRAIPIFIFGSILGGAVSGYCATFGAATGLRQISVSRYSFGWWPNKLIAFLNGLEQLGWASVASISGGLALTAVADGRISLVVGVVIIAVVSLLVSFLGLRYILIYERYAWLIYLVIFIIIFSMVGPYADDVTPAQVTGADLSASALSLLAVVYGSSASWATMVSDYYVQYPTNVSRLKVFALTTLGIAIPTSIGMTAGAVVASSLNNQTAWKDAYENEGLGFLIRDMLHPRGFAKFLLVIFSFSGINTNIISLYSAAISFQQMARPLAKIPRFLWTFLCFAVVVGLAVGGRSQLNTYLQNFLSLLGYWCTSYFVILLMEHTIFRRGDFANYDLEGWNDPSRLPLGIGASVAFLVGVVAWCMGMVETWFVGPLGGLIGESGGDIANELTLAVSALAYLPARYLELKYFGR